MSFANRLGFRRALVAVSAVFALLTAAAVEGQNCLYRCHIDTIFNWSQDAGGYEYDEWGCMLEDGTWCNGVGGVTGVCKAANFFCVIVGDLQDVETPCGWIELECDPGAWTDHIDGKNPRFCQQQGQNVPETDCENNG